MRLNFQSRQVHCRPRRSICCKFKSLSIWLFEQTVSKAFPLALMSKAEASTTCRRAKANRFSYRRLSSMQMSSGAFRLWPWSGGEETWLSLYAIDFLLNPVPEGVFPEREWLSLNGLREQMLSSAYNFLERQSRASSIPEKVYALLLRAKLGDPDVGEMRYVLSSQKGELNRTTAAQLGMAFTQVGDQERASEVLACL